ncbi:MAG: FecR family protein [Mariprofundaceae bacterium]
MGSYQTFQKQYCMIQALLFATLLLFASNAWAAAIGTVVDAKGDVTIQRAAESIKAIVGGTVHVGDIVQTGDESMTRIVLEGGDEISLGYNSKFVIDDYKLTAGGEIILAEFKALAGKFKFAVENIHKQEIYRVRTTTALLGVRGTQWFTLVEDEKTEVAGLDGLVSVTAGGQTKVIAKGETVVATLLGVGAIIATPAVLIELFLQQGISTSLSGAAVSATGSAVGTVAGVSTTAIIGGVAAAVGIAAVAGGADKAGATFPSNAGTTSVSFAFDTFTQQGLPGSDTYTASIDGHTFSSMGDGSTFTVDLPSHTQQNLSLHCSSIVISTPCIGRVMISGANHNGSSVIDDTTELRQSSNYTLSVF